MRTQKTIIFLAGFITCALLTTLVITLGQEIPFITGMTNQQNNAPSDWIKRGDITITKEAIILNIPNASLSNYAPTGSMKPLLDEKANGIRIKPVTPEQIHIGDIISFKKENLLIVHRIIGVGTDEEGLFYTTKGDNNYQTDGKVRFQEIEWVTIGILW